METKAQKTGGGRREGAAGFGMPEVSIADLSMPSPVALAPMAGITDAPFRSQVAQFGAGLVVSEMVASQEFTRNRHSTRFKTKLAAHERACGGCLVSVQVAGRVPSELAETARAAEAEGASIIDINMGCPARKVTSGGTGGSALMKEPELAKRIIAAVRSAVSIPVTLKMRLGWDHTMMTGVEIAAAAQDLGVSMLAVHGRTRAQFYKGSANWSAVRPIVDAVSIPVLVNGDIVDLAGASEALSSSGAAGVMIGRGAQARPWLLAEIEAGLGGGRFVPPTAAQTAQLAAQHYEAVLDHYGLDMGKRIARKHLGWRLALFADGPRLRGELLREEDPKTVLKTLRELENSVFVAGELRQMRSAGMQAA